MTQFMIFNYLIISSMIFFQMNHPLSMGLMLMIHTILISLMTGLMTHTFWFSYILFLMFIGGMLILFIYVVSLASNEMFNMSMKLLISMSLIIMMSFIIIFIFDKSFIINFLNNNDMNMIMNNSTFMKENMLTLYKIYNFPMNIITIMLINYLFITLIIVVKITNIFKGPLRPMN